MHVHQKTMLIISIASFCIVAVFLGKSLASAADKDQKALFDIKKACRSSVRSFETMLPVPKDTFEITIRDNPEYGREEEWTLKDEASLARFGIKFLKIEIHQNKVQSVFFTTTSSGLDSVSVFEDNLSKVKLSMQELQKVMEEYRVPNHGGFPIQILGNADYYQCFEYHAGH